MNRTLALTLLAAASLNAQAIRTNAGFRASAVQRNDDGSSALTPLGFTANFFGKQRTHAYVNNNGNITFDSALSTFTPFGLERTQREIIAPFFADVDTRNTASSLVTYGQDTVNNRPAFGVNYLNVGYYASHADKLNSFQLVLIDRSDTGAGNFDIEFNYQSILWETGDASNGVNGFGGTPAAVGWSNGTGEPGTSFELEGSLIPGAFLDGSPRSLRRNRLNSTVTGRYVFRARGGQIQPPLSILTGCPLPPASLSTPYRFQMEAVGGLSYRWEILADANASLPAGLTLSSAGVLSGIPTTTGTSEFTIRMTAATEDGDQTLSRRCSLTVNPPSLSITSGCPLPPATVGQPYNRTVGGSGGRGPYEWSLAEGSSPLPQGLSLTRTGQITGKPLVEGTANVTIRLASPSEGATPVVRTCSITVNPAVLDLTSACSLPPATMGVPYSQSLTVAGGSGPYVWTTADLLPAGLALSLNGRISGTPIGTGTATFTARVRDGRGETREQSCNLTVERPVVAVGTACPLPEGMTGDLYSERLSASGGTAPYSWSVLGTLPPGLSLSGDGVLAGNPISSGSFGFRFLVTDAEGRSAVQSCNVTFVRPAFALAGCPVPNATVGIDYARMLTADGGAGPYVFGNAGGLPPGLQLNTAGRISGRPTLAGTYPFQVRILDSQGQTTVQPCQITVVASPIEIGGTCPLPDATVGAPYLSRFTATGGATPYQFSISGALPSGLSMSTNGVITGIPVARGTSSFQVRVVDAQQRLSFRECSVEVVLPERPSLTLSAVPPVLNPASNGPAVTLSLSAPYPLPISGQFVLTVEPDTGSTQNLVDRADPRVRFTNGQQTLDFTIPAGSRTATATIASTGTVASNVTIQVRNLMAGGNTFPSLPAPRSFRVARQAPVLTDGCYNVTSTGIEAVLTGYSTTRDLRRAEFTLTIPGSDPVQRGVDLSETSAAYFSSDESLRNGGAFTLTLPVTIEGGQVSAVSVTLSNVPGTTASRTLNRCR